MHTRDLNAGMRCIKYLLFFFNLLFVITGILIIGVGTTIQAIYNNFDIFLEGRFYSPTTLLIVIGFIVFVVAFFGCCGAVRESTCMVMTFAVLLAIVFLLELSAGLAGYVLQDGLKEYLVHKVNISMEQYSTDPEIAETIDFMQERLLCCGLESYNDWEGKLDNMTYGTTQINENTTVPNSCCLETCDFISGNGCINRLEYVVGQSAVLLTSAALSLALLQLLGVMFACSLGRSIRHQKTERERRRWEMRENLLRKDTFYTDRKHSTSA
ncbi:CD63 antigen-like [Zootermopsis nevadensis]|uniref:Tetraspanin n=1 Tax=Zootermopsis nevadensis TaxID=136037 RepID=A0A067QFC7_ZOONE|nr:CD63 antigen-like [Zootermopsis nevadensis]XP_021941538.1 CD63 antigen-like [Zootermopsis nevadensis]KDR06365.1 Tetraspanin-33 [Zootermopsis nevadensis]